MGKTGTETGINAADDIGHGGSNRVIAIVVASVDHMNRIGV